MNHYTVILWLTTDAHAPLKTFVLIWVTTIDSWRLVLAHNRLALHQVQIKLRHTSQDKPV